MDFIAFARSLYTAVTTVQTLGQFVEDKLAPLLRSVGDVNYQAAARALQDINLSKEPRREVESAITHLRAAYKAYDGIRWPTADDHCKCVGSLCAIAVCYKYLGELSLMTSYLDTSRDAMHKWCWQVNQIEKSRKFVRGLGHLSYAWVNHKYLVGHYEALNARNDFDKACRS